MWWSGFTINMTPAEVLEFLADWEHQPDRLIGIPESQTIEFKSEPWDLDSTAGKFEAVKDIAAMANGGGGLIAIGIRTQEDPRHQADASAELTPFPPPAQFGLRLQDIVRSRTYPPLSGLAIALHPSGDGTTCLLSVHVPSSPNLTLVKKGGMAGGETAGILIPERLGGVVGWRSLPEVHALIHSGLRFDSLLARIAPFLTPERNDAAEEQWQVATDTDTESVVLQLVPPVSTELANLHDKEGIRGRLSAHAGVRAAGFNFDWVSRVDIQTSPSGGLTADHPGGERLWIGRRGELAVRLPISRDGLGWALKTDAPHINEIAVFEKLLEATLLFADVVWEGLSLTDGSTFVRLAVVGDDTDDPQVVLVRNMDGSVVADQVRIAVANPFQDFEVALQDAPGAAFELLRRFYSLFGLGSEEVPFQAGGRIEIDDFINHMQNWTRP